MKLRNDDLKSPSDDLAPDGGHFTSEAVGRIHLCPGIGLKKGAIDLFRGAISTRCSEMVWGHGQFSLCRDGGGRTAIRCSDAGDRRWRRQRRHPQSLGQGRRPLQHGLGGAKPGFRRSLGLHSVEGPWLSNIRNQAGGVADDAVGARLAISGWCHKSPEPTFHEAGEFRQFTRRMALRKSCNPVSAAGVLKRVVGCCGKKLSGDLRPMLRRRRTRASLLLK